MADLRLVQLQQQTQHYQSQRNQLKSQGGFPSIADPTSAKAHLFGRIILGAKTSIQKQHQEIKLYLEQEKAKHDENEKFERKLKKIADDEKERERDRKLLVARKEQLRQQRREKAKFLERQREKEFEAERRKMSE